MDAACCFEKSLVRRMVWTSTGGGCLPRFKWVRTLGAACPRSRHITLPAGQLEEETRLWEGGSPPCGREPPDPGGQLKKETRLWEGGSPPCGRAEGVSRSSGHLEPPVQGREDPFSL